MLLWGGKQIVDAILILNEGLDSKIKSGSPRVICKLDIEKAYDHISWECLLCMLNKLGFRGKWQSWIGFCISTARFSVLVNGTRSGFFDSSRDLRQGDPLLPLLFIIVMDILIKFLSKAEGWFVDWF